MCTSKYTLQCKTNFCSCKSYLENWQKVINPMLRSLKKKISHNIKTHPRFKTRKFLTGNTPLLKDTETSPSHSHMQSVLFWSRLPENNGLARSLFFGGRKNFFQMAFGAFENKIINHLAVGSRPSCFRYWQVIFLFI